MIDNIVVNIQQNEVLVSIPNNEVTVTTNSAEFYF